jgi:regulator of protease activity HflC (stomatin/prohibitin superfamily)
MSRLATTDSSSRNAFRAIVGGAVSFVLLLFVLGSIHSSFAKTGAGQIGVVRNGGPLDNNRIRDVLQPGSGLHWIGFKSHVHKYPSQQRFYTITADSGRGDRAGVDVEHDPTSDGVEVGVEGTIYFTLNLQTDVLKRFDDKYGTRQYRGADGGLRYAWEGEDGWNSFLDQIVRPVISNNFRETVGGYRCVDLLSACVYVQNTGNAKNVQQILASAKNNVNLSNVQTTVSDSLVRDVNSTLGGPFLTDIRVNLVRLTLPAELLKAVQDAQASFAAISSAQATVAKAQAEADANRQRQAGYNACPVCGQIDTLKAIPPTITTFAPGSGFSITAPSK